MSDRVHPNRSEEDWRRPTAERADPGGCGFPLWAAIDRGKHIRICGNPLVPESAVETAK
ncbi:MAG: hypothetical protein ACRENX_01600 [Candidatus Dormibacteria bacterium]